MSSPIILYDMPRSVPQGEDASQIGWSPNTLKTRIALGIKGLSYKTEWLKFVEVAPKMKELGLSANASGIPYTVPTIKDPASGKVITDSLAIAKYLDAQYPNTPRLIPPQTLALQVAFTEQVASPILMAAFPLIILNVHDQADEKDKVYFRQTRETWLGAKLEDIPPKGEDREKKLKTIEKLLDDAARWISQNDEAGIFITGEKPSHVDTVLAGYLLFIVRVAGKDHDLTKLIHTASGGKWATYLNTISKWVAEE